MSLTSLAGPKPSGMVRITDEECHKGLIVPREDYTNPIGGVRASERVFCSGTHVLNLAGALRFLRLSLPVLALRNVRCAKIRPRILHRKLVLPSRLESGRSAGRGGRLSVNESEGRKRDNKGLEGHGEEQGTGSWPLRRASCPAF